VQLGLGYLVRTCVVAWNQGVDLWGEADNRLALGCEYTASLLEGDKVHAYLKIQDRGRISDIYEAVLQHYKYEKHIDMPKTEVAVQKSRDKAVTVLQFFKGGALPQKLRPAPAPSTIAQMAGARGERAAQAGSVPVAPGESIQAALDKLKGGGGTVSLKAGVHTLPATLKLPSGVTIAGTGIDCVVFLDPAKGEYEAAIVNAEPDLHDIVLRDFVIEGAGSAEQSKDPNSDVQRRRTQHGPIRAGILFLGEGKTAQRNLRFENLTVRSCTFSGVYIYGAEQLDVVNCDFSGSGGMVPPGPGKNHNLKLNHVSRVNINGSRICDSMYGCGVQLAFGNDVTIRDCEIARNGLDGVSIAESSRVIVDGCLAEGNSGSAVKQEKWMDANQGIVLKNNTVRNNAAQS
jgi:hypothetical protein